MTIVHQYTIIYFTLIAQESMSIDIHRNLCLEAVVRFINHQDKCDFDFSTTEDILQDVTTCPKKCNFRIDDMSCYNTNTLRRINLTISNEKKTFFPCSRLLDDKKYLYISCLWNAGDYITWNDADDCFIKDAQCDRIYRYCVCHCMPGYILEDKRCLKNMVNISGICEHNWQCIGTEFANVCDDGLCSCSPGYIQIDWKCYQGNLELDDSCELTEQCIQPFSVCFNGTCNCLNGYSAFNTNSCLKDTVPVGGFCSINEQCTGSNNSEICEYGRCSCAKGFKFIDLACEKNQPTSLGTSNSQQHDTNIGVTLGTLFGGFIFGVIVTAVVTTIMYKKLKFQTRKRKEPDVMFAENREYGVVSGAQISFTNNKKQNVAKLSTYSFSNDTQGYNLSRKQENERPKDVYNHLHEQTEQDDDTYDHACAAPNHSADFSDYSNLRDTATVQPSPSKDGDDYSTLRH